MQFSVLSYHESWLKSISYGSFEKDFCNLLHFSSPESDIISYRLTLPPGSFATIADWKGVAFRRCWQIPPPLFMQKSALKGGVLNFIFFNRFQTCYTTIAEAMSFLHSSCSHLQVQTVPSSPWDAPCPVVTPSYFHRLGSALSAINDNYVFWLSA